MKKLGYIPLIALLLAATACADKEGEVFYATSYPVVRVEAEVTVPAPEPDPEPDPDPDPTDPDPTDPDPTDPNPTDPDPTAVAPRTADESETTDPEIERIEAEIVAAAPVQAGGRYRLQFTRYDGGSLQIDTATDAGTVRGEFFKTPGASEILFYCQEPALEYTCATSTYNGDDGRSKVVFTIDLTAEYQLLYPDAGITRAVRREYTSANAN